MPNSSRVGTARWLVSCDESGVHGAQYYGFGSLWMGWQRRGDFAREIRVLREQHDFFNEFKWKKAKSRKYHQFFLDLVQYFFRQPSLAFHCIVVRKAMVKKELHGGDYDLARRKHFTMLLTNKIKRCVRAQPGREHTFRIWVDPIASRYQKADEAVEVISNNVLARALGRVRPVDTVITRDSKDTDTIQLCDLFLGAVMERVAEGRIIPNEACCQPSNCRASWLGRSVRRYPPSRKEIQHLVFPRQDARSERASDAESQSSSSIATATSAVAKRSIPAHAQRSRASRRRSASERSERRSGRR